MTLAALGNMKVAYADLPADWREHAESCLLETLAIMDVQYVANIVRAFGQMRCAWSSVSPALQAVLQQTIAGALALMTNDVNVFITLQGLAKMGAKCNKGLLNNAEKVVIRMVSPEQLEAAPSMQRVTIAIYSLGKMGADWSVFSPAFREAVLNAFILLQDKFSAQGLSNFVYG